MTPDQWRKQLKKFDVPFREMPGWDKPNSGRDDETGLTFGPVYGGVQHHTGSDGPDKSNRDLIAKGRSDLPGPLAQAGLNDDGVIDLHTCHRANHAGGGDPMVLRAVRLQNYGDYPPHTNFHQGEPGAADGNDCFYGLEAYYFATLSDAMYNSMVGFWAAICDFHNWSSKAVIGHKEWSDWKPDPNLIDMRVFRKDIALRVAQPTGKPKPEGPKLIRPNVAAAIKASIAFSKALESINSQKVEPTADDFRVVVKKQRRALRDMERK